MTNKLASAKKFVQKHKAPIAATVGVVAGISITYYTVLHGRTLLEVHAHHVDYMREKEVALLYETIHGPVMITVPKHI